ncbi:MULTISPECIES: T7SS effector LXG polymorphic toxin [Bacillus]|uniref:T7SS effector LXG polymorphic toxin n=1 Tax=Bacillus TaxID=1386 RepID=UPI002000D955|nr:MULTISPECIES: T7SS effector LXG polymorphic toxin [Bacillus]UPL47310.1 LXG domain-containing protein [Bacillus sp. PGP15]WJE67966.1 T7SS effector LXG polymorphic toxin [Bacillus albus]
MSLNMYLGEVQNQTQSMNAVCTATIQGMEQVIQSIDAFATDTVLQGRTYSSAKIFFVQTFRPLAQGIIYLCEELIRQNDAFPRDFQSQVASTDVIEQEVREQIQEINQMIASIEVIDEATPMPGIDAIVAVLVEMRKKLEEKLEHLYEFNYTSSNNYSTALQLAASIATGLAEVQSGQGFSPVSGTFSTQGLNMEWTTSIQAITEEKKHHSEEISIIEESLFDKFKDTVGNNVEAMDQLYEKFIHQIENTPLIGQYYNYKKGQNEAVLAELKGILNTILHPIDSVEGAVYALSHIDETFAAVEQAISDSWNQDVVNGDWNSRAKWYGNVEMQVKLAIAELFVGTKGVDKVSTLGKTSKLSESVNFIQGTKNVITLDKFKQSVDMLNNILMSKNQFAYAGANNIRSKFDTPDFHRVEEKLSTHQFAKGEGSSSGNKGTGKTGVGKTGEGIPLEKVKPDVLKQIHADDNGAYGYLPKEGTAYNKPEYDFTNVEWTKEMQNVRKDYLEASKQLESDIEKMISEGFSKEKIAEHVVEARNQQKNAARENMTAEERAGLEERNIKKYGNPIGPTAESMFNKIRDSYIDKGIYESDEQVWKIIIQKSMQKDDVINTLLGLEH